MKKTDWFLLYYEWCKAILAVDLLWDVSDKDKLIVTPKPLTVFSLGDNQFVKRKADVIRYLGVAGAIMSISVWRKFEDDKLLISNRQPWRIYRLGLSIIMKRYTIFQWYTTVILLIVTYAVCAKKEDQEKILGVQLMYIKPNSNPNLNWRPTNAKMSLLWCY